VTACAADAALRTAVRRLLTGAREGGNFSIFAHGMELQDLPALTEAMRRRRGAGTHRSVHGLVRELGRGRSWVR
jgi:hypothetical protein